MSDQPVMTEEMRSVLPTFPILDVSNTEVAVVRLNGAGELQHGETGEKYFYLSAGGHKILFNKDSLNKVLKVIAGLTAALRDEAPTIEIASAEHRPS